MTSPADHPYWTLSDSDLPSPFLNAFETSSEARVGIGRWIGYYNAARRHSLQWMNHPWRRLAATATEIVALCTSIPTKIDLRQLRRMSDGISGKRIGRLRCLESSQC